MAESTPPLRNLVGRSARKRREELVLTQDDVAAAMREFGAAEWNRATVANFELGRRQLDLEELWLICAAIDLSLVELLAGDSEQMVAVETVSDSSFSLDLIRRCIAGKGPRADALRSESTGADADAHDETVRRLARRLDISPIRLADLALDLWGKPLPRERDDRLRDLQTPDAPARTIQALRGHVTRELADELRNAITKRKKQR